MRVYVKNICQRCMTRSGGKELYRLLKSLSTNKIEIDFSDVEYISITFLDESIQKLIEESYNITIYDPKGTVKRKLEKIKQWAEGD